MRVLPKLDVGALIAVCAAMGFKVSYVTVGGPNTVSLAGTWMQAPEERTITVTQGEHVSTVRVDGEGAEEAPDTVNALVKALNVVVYG